MSNMLRIRVPAFLPLSVSLAGLCVASACADPDPQGRFDDFAEAIAEDTGTTDTNPADATDTTTDLPPADTDPDCVTPPIAPEGEYFLAIHAAPFRTSPPVFVRTTIVNNGTTVDFTFQPLTADVDFDENFEPVPRPNPRQNVGTPIVSSGVTIAEDGSFSVVVTGLDVNGEANPITGSDLIGNLTLAGSFINSDEGCGNVPEGVVVSTTEVNMRNSDWTMVRMPEDPTTVDPVLLNCAELAAEPAPCVTPGEGSGS